MNRSTTTFSPGAESKRCNQLISAGIATAEALPDGSQPAGRAQSAADLMDWIRRVRRGDDGASAAFVERLYPVVIQWVRWFASQEPGEVPLAEAVFAGLFRGLRRFNGQESLEDWASRITIRTCLRKLRRTASSPAIRLEDFNDEELEVLRHLSVFGCEIPGDGCFAAQDIAERLLAGLRVDQRLVLSLLDLQGASTSDVGRLTGWSSLRVRVTAFFARRHIRRTLNALLAECRCEAGTTRCPSRVARRNPALFESSVTHVTI